MARGRLAMAFGCVLACGSAPAFADWETLSTSGDWTVRAATGTPDGRICAASTRAVGSNTDLSVEAAEGALSVVLTDPGWEVAEPVTAVEDYRLEGEGSAPPLRFAFVFGDSIVADASEEILDHLAAERETVLQGPEGPMGTFSLRGSSSALREMRACAGI